MSNLPIRTYQRKNAAKQTSILYKNPSIISRINTQVKSLKNNNVEVKEKVENIDDTLDYGLFDTTFDRLAKDAVLPPVPPVSEKSHDSWYDSSNNSLSMHNSLSTSIAQELIRRDIRTHAKVVRKGKKKKDSMIAVVSRVTRSKYPKAVKKTKRENGLATLSASEINIEKSVRLKRKYNRKKKDNNISKIEESKRDEKYVFSQISNYSSNNSSIIDHQLVVESVSSNNQPKVSETDSQSLDMSEITEETNAEEVPAKRKRAVWKMKIVLSPNKKVFQNKKRKSKSEGNSSSSHSITDIRIQKRKKFKNIDDNVPTTKDNQNQASIDHPVNKSEINSLSNINNISVNSLNDASIQINKAEANSSFNRIDNISMDTSKKEPIDSSKPLNCINILAHSTPYPNSNNSTNNKPVDSLELSTRIRSVARSPSYPNFKKSSDNKSMDPSEPSTNIKAVAHYKSHPNSNKNSDNKPMDPLKSSSNIKAVLRSTSHPNSNKNSDNKPMDRPALSRNIKVIAHSTAYVNSSNSIEVTKPTMRVKPCCVKLERYKENKIKDNYSKEFNNKVICISDFSHLPTEDNTYKNFKTTENNSSQMITRPCSIKISRIDVDKCLMPTSTTQETKRLQLDSRNRTNQFNIKECSISLSRISPSECKKIKLRESDLPTQNYHGLMCSTPLERPVKQSMVKVRFSPIDNLTSIKTKRQKIHVDDEPVSEELSKEKTDDLQNINIVKKNLHTYYNTSDVEESKGRKSSGKDSQESLSMDEQKTVELERKSYKRKKSNSFLQLASVRTEDSIYSATTINYNSSGTNPSKKVLGVSSDSDASQSLFGDTTTNEEKLLSSNDNTKNKTDAFPSKAFPHVTRRRNRKNSLQVPVCPVLKSDVSTVDAAASQESSNTENISFEDSSLSPTEIMENSQKIDTDTSTSNLLGFTKVDSFTRTNRSDKSLSDKSSQETTAESLSMDDEYSQKSQKTFEPCDNIKNKENVPKESVKSEEPKKQDTRMQDDNSLLSDPLEKTDMDDAIDCTPLTRRLNNLEMIAKSRETHRHCDLQLTPITESPFRGFPKEATTNALRSVHLSLEDSENLSVSAEIFNERASVFLKPGKLWARSLSILNNIQKDANLDALCVNKGKKWRQSVQAILAMQQQNPRKSSISGNTGVIQSCLKTNDNDKEPETHHKILPSVNCLPYTQVNTTFGSASPGRHIRRISIRVVPDNKKFSHIKYSPFLEAYGLTASKNKKICSQLSTQIAPLKETAVYNVQYKNAAIETIESGPVFTAREVVLQRCSQNDYIPFKECFPKSYLERCRKIGEGVYGEVFVHEEETESSVIKIIPIEGSELVNGETQKKFSEILSEIVIARELHNLRFNDKYNSNSFVEVKNIRCIVGKYPEKLVELWKIYDEEKNSDNDCPSMFNDNQLYIVLELGHGGQDLEAFVFQNASQSHALFIQTALALAVAEKSLEFEHRDLHWGNILISHTDETEVHYKLNDEKVSFKTKGVQAAIIDFTLSRMSYQGCCIFNDLALDPALFAAQGEYQFEIYRLMRDKVNNNWQKFEPYTNLLWLHYTLDKMITAVRYKNKKTKVHKNAIGQLQQLKDVVLNYNSAFDFVTNCEQVSRLQCGN